MNRTQSINKDTQSINRDIHKDILTLPEDKQQAYSQFHTQPLILSRKYTKTQLSTHNLINLLMYDYATPLRIDLANHSKSTVSNHLGVNPNVITTLLSVIQILEEK